MGGHLRPGHRSLPRRPPSGRVHNVYVLADCRGAGIGRRLVAEAVARARVRFDCLRLRADDEGPARLYESLGFRPCRDIPDCTHIMEWCD